MPSAVSSGDDILPCAQFTHEGPPQSIARGDRRGLERLERINQAVNNTPYSVLFLGDSLTEGWDPVLWESRFSRLVLVAPLALNCAGATNATLPTCTASSAPNICVSPGPSQAKGEADYTALPDTELAAIVRGREAFALYGWKPYMHNPAPKALAAPDRPADPALLWGAQDGIVTPSYGDGLRQEIPDARIDIIPAVGHFPHWEQPEEFVQRLSAFVDGRNA